jgi:hypothetical protein
MATNDHTYASRIVPRPAREESCARRPQYPEVEVGEDGLRFVLAHPH